MPDDLEARVAHALANPVAVTVGAGERSGLRLNFTYDYATPWGDVQRRAFRHHLAADALADGATAALALFEQDLLVAIEDAQTGGDEFGWAPGPMDVLSLDVQLTALEPAPLEGA